MNEHTLSQVKLVSPDVLPQALENCLAAAQENGLQVVLVTGVFDVVHAEHLRFLRKARELGGLLVVGIESDARVQRLKGAGRPIHTEQTRLQFLQDQKVADCVFILPEQFDNREDHEQLIRAIHPRYLAVSSHTTHLDRKRKILALVGGEVRVVHEHNPAVSTTLLVTGELEE